MNKLFRHLGGNAMRLIAKGWINLQTRVLPRMSEYQRDLLVREQIEALLPLSETVVLKGIGQDANRKAAELNAELFREVNSIPEKELQEIRQQIRAYGEKNKFIPEYLDAHLRHASRYFLTLQWLEPILASLPADAVILDLGGESVATNLSRLKFSQYNIANLTVDLRYSWPVEPRSVDLIICTELVEHVTDLPDGLNDTFYATGLKALLGECLKALKPGGVMFLTTPNVNSVLQLNKAFAGASPWFYTLHIREYTAGEMINYLEEAGFKVDYWKDIQCIIPDGDFTDTFRVLLNTPFPNATEHRGDDLFFILHKPT